MPMAGRRRHAGWPRGAIVAAAIAIAAGTLLPLPVAAGPTAPGADVLPGGDLPDVDGTVRLLLHTASGRVPGPNAGVTPRLLADGETWVVDVPEAAARPTAATLAQDRDVVSVRLDAVLHAQQVWTQEPRWADQRAAAEHLRLTEMWQVTRGRGSTVAVIDTGVTSSHPELAGRVRPGRSFVAGAPTAEDDDGHGTFVARLAVAAWDGIAAAGTCPTCRVLPVKVLDGNGSGFAADVADGIRWAADQTGVEVINLSLAGPQTTAELDDALAYADARGITIVAAAGNQASVAPYYPAASPGVLSVGAADTLDRTESYSNRGTWVDVAAPGCWPSGSTRGLACGTSFAAAVVSGVAAVARGELRATAPTFSSRTVADEVDTAFFATAKSTATTGVDTRFGRVDAARTVRWTRPRVHLLGDWDGDGTATPAVYTDGVIAWTDELSSPGNVREVRYGGIGWLAAAGPLAAPAGGPTTDGVVVSPPSGVAANRYFVLDRLTPGAAVADREQRFGRAGWRLVVGDWDADGRATLGVVDGNRWYVTDDPVATTPAASASFAYGRAGDRILAGEWGPPPAGDLPGIYVGDRFHLARDDAPATGGYTGEAVHYGPVDRNRPAATPLRWKVSGSGDGVGLATLNRWYLRSTSTSGTATAVLDFGG